MKVKLVPVIEIFNSNENIKLPDFGPSWEYKDEWEAYNCLCNKAAGFSDDLKPHQKASRFYAIDELSDADLLLAIQKEIDFEESGETDTADAIDFITPFSGGYILELDNMAVYFPQCCGSLADIKEWKDLIIGKTSSFFAGHPFPRVTENGNKIRFDFVDIEVKENFAPPCLFDVLEIEKSDLQSAIDLADTSLHILSERLKAINRSEKLDIENIEQKLIWAENEF